MNLVVKHICLTIFGIGTVGVVILMLILAMVLINPYNSLMVPKYIDWVLINPYVRIVIVALGYLVGKGLYARYFID